MANGHLECMTVEEVQKISCNHNGCHASTKQMRFEPASRNGLIISAVCPYGHRRFIQIKSQKEILRQAMKKKNDIWKSGPCETPGCKGYWKSKAGNKRFCPRCGEERLRKARIDWYLRNKEKRELLKKKISSAARPLEINV